MKRVINLLLVSLIATSAKGQVIEFVKYKAQADVVVHFVDCKQEADVCVWEGPKYAAQQVRGIWFYDDMDPYRVKVYIAKYKHEAEILIYVVDDKWEIETNENYKQLFYEIVD